jgi:CSLREA domain-containing protein
MRELWSCMATSMWGGRWRRLAFGCAMALGCGFVLAACQTGGLNLTVNTTHDGHDANPGDGVCAMTAGHHDCSLRAALEESNASTSSASNVVVPSGRYHLTVGPLASDRASAATSITATGHGAVIVASGEPVGLEATGGDTALSGISVTGAVGAGFQVSSGATLVVTSGSSYDNGTGFVVEPGATAAAGEVTLSDNSGAGLDDEGIFDAVFTTVTANGGGGVIGSGTTSLQATIVSDQASGADCAAPITSQNFNLDSDGSCGLSQFNDISSRSARLGGLSSGLSPAHAPQLGSPVINVVPTGVGPCTPHPGFLDQRGRTRPVGNGCDIGAVEATFAPLNLVVNSTSDDNSDDTRPGDGRCIVTRRTCTLRAAIEEANAYPSSGDTIDIEVGSASIEWFEPFEVDITDGVAIHGNGATLFAGQGPRGLTVLASTTIDQLTVTGGFTHENGAGILATAPLTLDHVSVVGNDAINTGGGGIVTSADLTLIDSTVSGNLSGGPDAAIVATGGATTIIDSAITGNSANSSDNPGGEAPVVDLKGTSATITGTTISGNNSLLPGTAGAGAVLLDTPTATVTNSTISDNQVASPFEQGHAETGGVGVVVRSGSVRFVNDTLSGNEGQLDPVTLQPTGPTIEAEGSLTLLGTIVSAPSGLACSAPLAASGGYNLVSDTSCGLSGTGDQQAVDALLGPVAANGGPTQTQLPGAGSPAIDAVPIGTAGLCDGTVTTDQRGVVRPTGPACDIGSTEQ